MTWKIDFVRISKSKIHNMFHFFKILLLFEAGKDIQEMNTLYVVLLFKTIFIGNNQITLIWNALGIERVIENAKGPSINDVGNWKGEGVKNWSKLPMDSTKNLLTWGREGGKKSGKKCWRRLWMVPKIELIFRHASDLELIFPPCTNELWLDFTNFVWESWFNSV